VAEEIVEIREYVTEEGRIPFREWLDNLKDREARARVRVRLNRIRLGNFGDVKPVGIGVSELRISHGPGYRVYFAQRGNTVVILLCGGDKRSQSKDIALAKSYWAELQKRER
jgi:putative addiction module killer protein